MRNRVGRRDHRPRRPQQGFPHGLGSGLFVKHEGWFASPSSFLWEWYGLLLSHPDRDTGRHSVLVATAVVDLWHSPACERRFRGAAGRSKGKPPLAQGEWRVSPTQTHTFYIVTFVPANKYPARKCLCSNQQMKAARREPYISAAHLHTLTTKSRVIIRLGNEVCNHCATLRSRRTRPHGENPLATS
jgi:hypothetical protein